MLDQWFANVAPQINRAGAAPAARRSLGPASRIRAFLEVLSAKPEQQSPLRMPPDKQTWITCNTAGNHPLGWERNHENRAAARATSLSDGSAERE
jgi:hypothetical protein